MQSKDNSFNLVFVVISTTGDARVVQTPMLAQWHSLFLRLHNLIAPQISANDEVAYQEGKRLTTALYQRIVYNEWLPVILGNCEVIF